MRTRITAALAMVAVCLVSASPSNATTQKLSNKTDVTIKAAVSTRCSVTTFPIAFTLGSGFVQSPGSSLVKHSSLALKCTKGANVAVGMNRGLYAGSTSATFGSRSMRLTVTNSKGGWQYLGYDLFHDNACTTVWAPTGFTYVSPSDAGSSVDVYARVITGQQVVLGTYTDTITATLNF
jgi:spore coat protein U-like protein